jgi:hypothetical protein
MSIGYEDEGETSQVNRRRDPPACYARTASEMDDGDTLVDTQFRAALLVLSIGICTATFLVLHGGFHL